MAKDAKDMRIAVAMAAHLSYRDNRLGTFGAASPVRRICPITGEVLPEPVAIQPTATPAAKPVRRFTSRFKRRRPGYFDKQFAAKMADDKA